MSVSCLYLPFNSGRADETFNGRDLRGIGFPALHDQPRTLTQQLFFSIGQHACTHGLFALRIAFYADGLNDGARSGSQGLNRIDQLRWLRSCSIKHIGAARHSRRQVLLGSLGIRAALGLPVQERSKSNSTFEFVTVIPI